MKKLNKTLLHLSLLFYINVSWASVTNSVEFFSSNNKGKIDTLTAFQRLRGKEQERLRCKINKVAEENHLKGWQVEDSLGVYRRIKDKEITAENVAELIAPFSAQRIDKKVFSMAKQLANDLSQESVAVFISNSKSAVGEVTLEFVSSPLTVDETLAKLHEELPAVYSSSFTLHLLRINSGFNNAKVISVTWLGRKIKLGEIKKIFPHEKFFYQFGDAFLVYKDGHVDRL